MSKFAPKPRRDDPIEPAILPATAEAILVKVQSCFSMQCSMLTSNLPSNSFSCSWGHFPTLLPFVTLFTVHTLSLSSWYLTLWTLSVLPKLKSSMHAHWHDLINSCYICENENQSFVEQQLPRLADSTKTVSLSLDWKAPPVHHMVVLTPPDHGSLSL